MKKLILALSVIVMILLPVFAPQTVALSCAEPDLPHIEYEKYDGVIIGKIVKIEEQERENLKLLTVEVDKSYKGIQSNTVTIQEMLMWSESQVDQTKLFFLVHEEGKWINGGFCGPTTSNIALADQFLSDKAELVLTDEDAEIEASPSSNTTMVVIAFTLIVVIVLFVLKRKV